MVRGNGRANWDGTRDLPLAFHWWMLRAGVPPTKYKVTTKLRGVGMKFWHRPQASEMGRPQAPRLVAGGVPGGSVLQAFLLPLLRLLPGHRRMS